MGVVCAGGGRIIHGKGGKKRGSRLTGPRRTAIIQTKGTLRKAAGPSESISLDGKRPPRNRHWSEWRFLHFTTIVTVNRPICNVIRIRPHLLSEDVASRLSAAQHSRPFGGREYFITGRGACQIASPPLFSPCSFRMATRVPLSSAPRIKTFADMYSQIISTTTVPMDP